MRVLITGGGGFIGSWIARAMLAAGHDVRIFDLHDERRMMGMIVGEATASAMDWRTGNIADTGTVELAAKDCDAIVHLAGLLTPACRADPLNGVSVNLVGTLNVFLVARKFGIARVLYMSSAGVFGADASGEPRPVTHYGAFKLACENSAAAFWEDDRIASIGFRPFVVYGPGREGGLSAGPSLACEAAARGQDYTIPFTGRFDIIHVEDVASAFVQALALPPEGARVFNLSGGMASAQDVVAAISACAPDVRIDATGNPMPITCPEPDGLIQVALPKWHARDLATGIADTISYHQARAGQTGAAG
ncbi:MAG: NAD-dependent epimerase/dehydratase family protein [Hoeflea sp.]|uniref:NAD-dependent epimerase/dehydratase family protein n=1 Tax=Hoeflea sp. TaxID=1940281 RepID=UPI00329A1FFE